MIARHRLAVAVMTAAVLMLASGAALAQADAPAEQEYGFEDFFELEGVPDDLEEPWREFLDGWAAFRDWHYLVQQATGLLLAALLGALIGFHPRSRHGVQGLVMDREEAIQDFEKPKAIIIYAVVGAAVSEIVLFNPPMAFVIFGMGALLRFRSLVGNTKDTGRTIFAAMMGLACGLKLFSLAVLGTAFLWVLLWVLERYVPILLEVRKLPEGGLPAATRAWEKALVEAGCRIQGQAVNEAKGRVEILALVPRDADLRGIPGLVKLPPEQAGEAAWKHG